MSAFGGALILLGVSSAARAQTTVTLNQNKSQVVYATIRGGSHANENDRSVLATRSSDDLQYERRALLKFDTQNTIPEGASVTSATLTVTVKSGGSDGTRQIAAYQVSQSWTETEVTWKLRRSGESWSNAGGTYGSKLATATVGNAAGTKVSFNVTSLVKAAVAGDLGSSRYTRIALMDMDASTSDSYREFHLPTDGTAANRPTLKVTYTTGRSSSGGDGGGGSTATSSGTTLKVLQWNTHHGGVGTDGVWNPQRLVNWIAKINPDIVSLNEMEYKTGWSKGTDEPAWIASHLASATGRTWYYRFATAAGGSTGNGNMILSKYPFHAVAVNPLAHDRVAVNVAITVNGRTINFFSTHLDANSTSYRLGEIGEVTSWAGGIAQQRIIAGDFNAWPGSSENGTMTNSYYDSWAKAVADNTDVAYSGNSAGNTRNSRIDYIYYSHSASALVLRSSQVFDTRDSNGVMPSDHRPVMSTFTVK